MEESTFKYSLEHKAVTRVNPELVTILHEGELPVEFKSTTIIGTRKLGLLDRLKVYFPHPEINLIEIIKWIRTGKQIPIISRIRCSRMLLGNVGRLDFQMLNNSVWFIREIFVGREPDHIPDSLLSKADQEYYRDSSRQLRGRGVGTAVLDVFEDLAEICGVRQIIASEDFSRFAWEYCRFEEWLGINLDGFVSRLVLENQLSGHRELEVFLAYPEISNSVPLTDFLENNLRRVLEDRSIPQDIRVILHDDLQRLVFFKHNGYSIYGINVTHRNDLWIPRFLLICKDFSYADIWRERTI